MPVPPAPDEPDPSPGSDASAWRADLRHRFLDRLVLKATGVSVFIWIFFQGYFHTLRHPVYPVTTMPLTALDRAIPFEPLSIVAYVSLWIYVGIAPGLMLRLRDLLLYGAWAAALCVGGLLIFHFWPTQVPPRPPELAALPGFGLLAGIDGAGNACPSLHVATAVFTAAWVARLGHWMRAPAGWQLLNALWLLAIAWSTIASRQHVALDVLAGAAWGAAFAGLSLWITPRLGARIGPVPTASRRYHPVTIDRRSTVYPAPRPEDSP